MQGRANRCSRIWLNRFTSICDPWNTVQWYCSIQDSSFYDELWTDVLPRDIAGAQSEVHQGRACRSCADVRLLSETALTPWETLVYVLLGASEVLRSNRQVSGWSLFGRNIIDKSYTFCSKNQTARDIILLLRPCLRLSRVWEWEDSQLIRRLIGWLNADTLSSDRHEPNDAFVAQPESCVIFLFSG